MNLRKQKKTTAKNFHERMKLFMNAIEECKQNKEAMNFVCECFDEMLERLADEDFFGTERQSDPRGDPR